MATFAMHGDVCVITLCHPPLNTLSHAVRRDLAAHIALAGQSPMVKGIVITGDGKAFCGGADITEFESGGAMRGPYLPALIAEIEACPKVVVAALNGLAFGGGLELALGCHFRIGTTAASVALPEVLIGIVPGAGGTQRLPRLIGVQPSIDMICSGRTVDSAEAQKMGVLDHVVPNTSELLPAAIARARADGGDLDELRICNKVVRDPAFDAVIAGARSMLSAKARGFEAPLACLDALAASVLPFVDGMAVENATIARLMMSHQAKALRHVFFAERQASKAEGAVAALPISTVGVVGAGTMGAGIAVCAAKAGCKVVVLETDTKALEAGRARVVGIVKGWVKKGKLSDAEAESMLQATVFTLNFQDFSKADIVIEAVFEEMTLKQRIFAQLDKIVPPHALLCSNTSTLDVDKIAAATNRPQKVMGTHFFSPAHAMKLMENIRGKDTSAETIATVVALSKRLGKISVIVGNCDGFVGNRMLEPYGQEAAYLLEEGATPFEVDQALQAYGMAMGPFAMGDLAGLDIGFRIRRGFANQNSQSTTTTTTNARLCAGKKIAIAPSPRYAAYIADKLCEAGRLGQKSKAGWYVYKNGAGRPGDQDPGVITMLEARSKELGLVRRSITAQEIVERCLLPLVNEGFRVLEEGIATRASDIDVIWVHGYGFPRHQGGPMFWADAQLGLPTVLARIKFWHQKNPHCPYWRPSALLERLVAEKISLRDFDAGRTAQPALSAKL